MWVRRARCCLFLVCITAGCSDGRSDDDGRGDELGSTTAETGGLDEGSEGTTEGDSGTGSEGETGSEDGQDNQPPIIESFLVNNSQMPPTVEEASFVQLSAVIVDDTGIDRVEFLDGPTVLTTLEVPPDQTSFEFTWLVSGDEFDGPHPLSVRAVDLAANETTSSPVELLVEQPPSGLLRWSTLWDRGTGDNDWAHACALTELGALAVGGRSEGSDGVFRDAWADNFAAVNGSLLGSWTAPLIVDGSVDDGQADLRALAEFMDSDDLALAGTRDGDIWVGRYSPAGFKLWLRHDLITNASDYVGGVAAGMAQVVVALTGDGDGYLRSYDEATGDAMGQLLVEGTQLRGLAMTEEGELIAVGERDNDIYIARANADLELVWEQTIDGGVGSDEGLSVATHPSGSIAVAGSVMGLSSKDIWVGVLESDGSLRWSSSYDYNNGLDRAVGVAIDPLERVVVTGRATVDPQLGPTVQGDIMTLSYSAQGDVRWATLPEAGDGDHSETGTAVCLDEVGNVFVVGYLWDQKLDWWMARYAP